MTTWDEAQVERRLRRLGPLLAAADVPAPRLVFPAVRVVAVRRQRTLARWRIAAALALLAAAMSAEPVRAWVAARARAVWATFKPATPAAPEAVLPPAHASVAFVPAAGRFEIRIQTRQAAGRLTVRFVDDTAATASAAAGAGEWLVFESGIALRNAPEGTASVRIDVPARARSVSVQIGNEPAIVRSGDFSVAIGRSVPK